MRRFTRKSPVFAAVLAGIAAIGAPETAAGESAPPPVLSMPADCRLNQNCWAVVLHDHDPGPGVRDYACGVQAYDGHDGVDIAVRDYAVMHQGVDVLAAADGVVGGARDGETDFARLKGGAGAVSGKDCGNGARVEHGGGWATLYCHLLRGSVTVKRGQRIKRGDVIGKIGMSGMTTFPHVEFAVLKNDEKIDPFTGGGTGSADARACAISQNALWAADDPMRAAYTFGPLYAAGFAARGVTFDEIKNGHQRRTEFSADAPALVMYAVSYFTQPGDVWEISITGPDGKPAHRHTQTVKKGKPHSMIFSGIKRPGAAWPKGAYTGAAVLRRGGESLMLRRTMTVK